MISPQCIMDQDGRDVIADALKGAGWEDADLPAYLWARWRYAPLATCDVDRWVRRAADRALLDRRRWTAIFGAFDAVEDITDMRMGETVTDSSTYRDLEGSRDSTASTPGTVTRVSDSGTDSTTHEDIPQSAGASASEWLSGRDRTSHGKTTTTSSTGTDSVSVMYSKANTTTHDTRRSTLGGTPSEALAKLEGTIRDPRADYAETWSYLFGSVWL